jgi:hypothetical protein
MLHIESAIHLGEQREDGDLQSGNLSSDGAGTATRSQEF